MKRLSILLALILALPGLAWAQRVALDTTLGTIVIELAPQAAPKTVANFIDYVKSGHYNNTVFHRVIGNFMIQAGGYTADMSEKPTRAPIPLESQGGLKNERGAVSMARRADPNSADVTVLHQRRGQSESRLPEAATATATQSSARWSRAWTSSTRSAPYRRDRTARTRTCRPLRSSSSPHAS